MKSGRTSRRDVARLKRASATRLHWKSTEHTPGSTTARSCASRGWISGTSFAGGRLVSTTLELEISRPPLGLRLENWREGRASCLRASDHWRKRSGRERRDPWRCLRCRGRRWRDSERAAAGRASVVTGAALRAAASMRPPGRLGVGFECRRCLAPQDSEMAPGSSFEGRKRWATVH